MMHWRFEEVSRELIEPLCRQLGISPVVAALLARRGWKDPSAAERFLHPKLAHLQDPFLLTNLSQAVDRLIRAIESEESVVIVGDYDVDGVTSTVLLVGLLHRFGLFPRFYVPRRLEEGYGLSEAALARILDEGKPDLLVALDCGTNSLNEVAFLRECGIDVVIVDHHQSKDKAPEDCILVNPHVFDPPNSPWSDLCTVGLVFKLAHGLVKRLRESGNEAALQLDIRKMLDLVAMGTVADMVPLIGENRIFAKYGLKALGECHRVGMGALFEVAGIERGQELTPVDISYRLGPRINASGRLGDASLPVEMLLSNDYCHCSESARQLEVFNRERQDIERLIYEQATEQVATHMADAAGLVVYGDEWHPGVVGIVAGKLAREYHRPCIVLGNEGELARGSGRSIPGLNLQAVLAACSRYLREWGGHPMAVGVSVEKSQIIPFREFFAETVEKHLRQNPVLPPEIEISAWIELAEITEDWFRQLELLGPFGEGNPEPIFGVRNVILRYPLQLFGKSHFRFQLELGPGRRLPGVAWRQAESLPPLYTPLEMALRLSRKYWNGRTFIQAELVSWRLSPER